LWHIVSGTGIIVGNTIEVDGVVATTICHPTRYENGSWIIRMKLIDVRSADYYEIGAGNPLSSDYRIQWVPSDKDTINEKITIRVYDGSVWKEYAQTWTASADTVEVTACYQPGAILHGDVGIVPGVDACIPLDPHDNCYADGGDEIGNFFFTRGRFDDWVYETTIIDEKTCLPCQCFCYIYSVPLDLEEWSCYPDILTLTLELMSGGDCVELDDMTIAMTAGNLSGGDGWPEKKSWYSDVLTCTIPTTASYTFILDCTTVETGDGYWFLALSLRIGDAAYLPSSTVFQWEDTTGSIGYVSNTTRLPDPRESNCVPLDLSYPNMKINSVFGPCGPPGNFGYFPFCCDASGQPNGCYASSPTILFRVRVTI